jgi:hypothetical protein
MLGIRTADPARLTDVVDLVVGAVIEPDPALLAASAAFAGACGFGSAVALSQSLPGEPLGIRLPITVPRGLLMGWGAGVAAPWPMPLAAVVAAATAGRVGNKSVPGAVCVGLGIACILGTLVEPVTRRPRSWTPGVCAAIGINLATSAVLAAAGVRYARR